MAKTAPSPVADLKVRQAIDLAIDREEAMDALKGGHGTRSLFPQNTPYYQDNLGSSLAKATEVIYIAFFKWVFCSKLHCVDKLTFKHPHSIIGDPNIISIFVRVEVN